METVGLEKHELPPTNQKRMVAFINHFVLSTVNFLNKFASDCESKFIRYEHKIQSLEASISIVEAKLSSIDALRKEADVSAMNQIPTEGNTPTDIEERTAEDVSLPEQPADELEVTKRDPTYDKYFKMIQVGVPIPAVKSKIGSEGLDPSYIDAFL
ncbi:WASH complex subunit 3 [Armigeres subalbatus]|uniref:WASH complex subunit 3 n=1 Tax=Armigeres subalbatus TaxID=124917 RepID=UPI002ED1F03D